MMKLEIFGTGCNKCQQLEENVRQALKQLGITADIKKVEDLADIADRGIMLTPTLAVDGEPKLVGKVGKVSEIKKLLQESQ